MVFGSQSISWLTAVMPSGQPSSGESASTQQGSVRRRESQSNLPFRGSSTENQEKLGIVFIVWNQGEQFNGTASEFLFGNI